MATITITEEILVGANRHGYTFAVGKVDGFWIGYARCVINEAGQRQPFLCVFPAVSRGIDLGVPERDLAIRMTATIALAAEEGYGGVDRWFVPEELRTEPPGFRCAKCEEIGCEGDCDFNPFDDGAA